MKLPALRLLTALAAALAVAPALAADAKPAFKPDAARGQAASAACQACHLADGSRGVAANPILQGQHPEYIVKQLGEFKAGKRQNAIMNAMAAPLTEEQMQDIAAFYAGKSAQSGAARNKDSVLLGEQIYRGGVAARKIPACSGCHSPTGAGIPAQYPRIGSQHEEYVEAQLVAFRSGARANNAPMRAIAAKMSDDEIKAVADYIAGLR